MQYFNDDICRDQSMRNVKTLVYFGLFDRLCSDNQMQKKCFVYRKKSFKFEFNIFILLKAYQF